MNITLSGWNEKLGSYSFDIFVDEQKDNYEIHFKDGFVAKQTTPFQYVTQDWNHDGDVYTMFGAWFESKFGGSDFWSADEMVSGLVLSAQEEGYRDTYKIACIPGIELPDALQRQPPRSPLNERIANALSRVKETSNTAPSHVDINRGRGAISIEDNPQKHTKPNRER